MQMPNKTESSAWSKDSPGAFRLKMAICWVLRARALQAMTTNPLAAHSEIPMLSGFNDFPGQTLCALHS